MKRFSLFLTLLLGGFMLMGADGCSSDPNVEGAKLDLRNKDYDRALENLSTALEKNPDNPEALELKGQVLQEKAFTTQDPEAHAELIQQAIEAYERALALNPEIAAAVHRNLAIAYVNEFQLGVQAFNRGRTNDDEFNAAARYFETAALIAPDSAGAYTNQAFSLMNAGRDAEAIEPFEKAIALGDHEPDTYRFLSNLYLTNDRAADAVSLLEGAAEEHPDNADIRAQLLNAYQMSGNMDRAMEKYREAVVDDPNNKVYRYNYGSLLLENEQYEAAIEQLQKAVDLDSEYANAQYNLGAAFVNQAVTINDQINKIDDDLRANRANLSAEQIKAREAEIDRLTEERRALFQQAVAPLEKAKALFEVAGEDATAICQVLFQSYVQTNQREKAESVSECAGYGDIN